MEPSIGIGIRGLEPSLITGLRSATPSIGPATHRLMRYVSWPAHANSLSSAFASLRSGVSKPSVNQP